MIPLSSGETLKVASVSGLNNEMDKLPQSSPFVGKIPEYLSGTWIRGSLSYNSPIRETGDLPVPARRRFVIKEITATELRPRSA